MKSVISCVLLAVLLTGALAQGKPRLSVPGTYLLRDQKCQPVLLAGVKCLYVLQKGVLARYDAATLALQATRELLPPLTDIPAQGDLTAKQQTDLINARVMRLLPAAMTLHGNELVALIGDQYALVDPVSLELKLSKPLHANTAQANRLDELFDEPAPELQFAGDTFYLIHAHQYPAHEAIITAVNGRDGTVLAEKSLPRSLDLPLDTWRPLTGGPTFDELNAGMMHPPCASLAIGEGVYVLRCGALAILDPHSLAEVKVNELYGALPTPSPAALPAEIQAASINRAQRLLPPAMLIQGGELCIVQGEDVFLVNMATQEVTKHVSLVPPAGVTREARTRELLTLGAPTLQQTKSGVLITRGKECWLLNPVDGTCRALQLPEQMTRALPLHEKAVNFTPLVPKDGDKLNMDAVLWQETGAKGVVWHCFSGQYGEFLLSGDSLAKCANNAELLRGMVNIRGVFHKGDGGANAPLGTLAVTGDIQGFGMLPLPGTVQKRKLPEGEVWTVSGQYTGEDYVLVGDKVKELNTVPDAANRPIFIMGKYSRVMEKMPRYGHGYLTLDTYNFQTTPAMEAAVKEKVRSVLGIAMNENLYLLRNGVIARFDAAAQTPAQVRDLLQDAPKIPGVKDIPEQLLTTLNGERPKRSATPLLFPLGNELVVFIPGAGYYRLDSTTLKDKATLGADHYPFSIDANSSLFAAQRLYAVNGSTLLALNIADGSVLGNGELPKQMLAGLFQ